MFVFSISINMNKNYMCIPLFSLHAKIGAPISRPSVFPSVDTIMVIPLIVPLVDGFVKNKCKEG